MITIDDLKKDESLINEFVRENQRLVTMVIKKHFSYVNNTADYDDYFQTGCIGLVNAAKRFKPEYGTAFSTYAVPMITGEIMRYRRDFCVSSIHSPRSIKDKYFRYQALRNSGASEAEACSKLGMDSTELSVVANAVEPAFSLDAAVYDNDNGTPVTGGDVVGSSFSLEQEALGRLTFLEIAGYLKGLLSETDMKILMLYLQQKTQVNIGKAIGMSQVNISRRIKKIRQVCRYVKLCHDKGIKPDSIRDLCIEEKVG